MALSMIRLGLILIVMVLLSKHHVSAQVDCGNVIVKLINCESFLFGYSNQPSPQCCASAQDLVQAANASKDVLKATCRCLKNAVQTLPVNLSNAARITPLCHLNLDIPISPSVDCDSL
ncbi:putative plant lipid transfer protein/Par allergen [Helianthus anomalus]